MPPLSSKAVIYDGVCSEFYCHRLCHKEEAFIFVSSKRLSFNLPRQTIDEMTIKSSNPIMGGE